MSGRRRIMISVPASVNSSSPIVLPSSTCINSSTRLIQGVSYSSISMSELLYLPLLFVSFENQAGVMTTKAHCIRQSYIHRRLSRFVRHIIELTIRVWMVQVDRRRYNTGQDCHDRYHSLNRPRCTQCMPNH